MTDWQLWWQVKMIDFKISLLVMGAIFALGIPAMLIKIWLDNRKWKREKGEK